MKKIKNNVFLMWMAGLLIGVSCTTPTDIQVERETVDLAFPVFTSETSISELIDGGVDSTALVVHSDHEMGLYYETKTHVGVSMPELEDMSLDLNPMTTIPNLPVSGVNIEKAKFDGGTMSFSFRNTQFDKNIKVVLRVNQLSKDGGIFSKTLDLDYTGSFPVTADVAVPLEGYKMDISQSPLQIEYQASFNDGSTASIDEAKMEMKEAEFGWVEGDWGVQSIPVETPDHEIGFFDHYSNGGVVHFANPKLNIIAQNSVGIPSKFVFNGITVNTLGSGEISVFGDFVDDGFSLAYPSIDQLGTYLTSVDEMNKTNSNIVEIFNAQPTDINYDIDFLVSPGGNGTGFIAKDAGVDLTMGVELPFEGTLSDFKVEKSFDVKFTNEYVQAATMKLYAKNQIPLDARIQMYFLDNAGIVLDSLVASNGILAVSSAIVAPSGDVIQAKKWDEEVSIDLDKWSRIKSAVEVKLVTSFTSSSAGQVPVKIKSNQRVELNAGLKLVVQP
ncbi:MAG TPA: hypothetical protein ENK85_02400 [Saprospiraceae bacterium]|nr:hypothetical protein [Saprospiraceae bacterium]